MEFLWNFLEGISRHTKFRRNFAAFSAVTSARLLRRATPPGNFAKIYAATFAAETSPRSCDTNSTMLRSSHCEETRKDRRSQQHISWSFQQGIQTTSITIHRATQMPHMMFTSLFPATESEKNKTSHELRSAGKRIKVTYSTTKGNVCGHFGVGFNYCVTPKAWQVFREKTIGLRRVQDQ